MIRILDLAHNRRKAHFSRAYFSQALRFSHVVHHVLLSQWCDLSQEVLAHPRLPITQSQFFDFNVSIFKFPSSPLFLIFYSQTSQVLFQ